MTAQLQVALDRLDIDRAQRIAGAVGPHADWVEVGTSLIKEFGMESVRRVVAAVQATGARVLADVKTNDNARYEFELCFDAGAEAATVMATAPDPTLATCFDVARERGTAVMVDLLATDEHRQRHLLDCFPHGVFAVHVSKDVQESSGGTVADELAPWLGDRRVAVAGGVTLAHIPGLLARNGDLTVIVGSAISGADDPAAVASQFAAVLAGGSPT